MRIATLLPSATEIVCGLGLESALVATSHECDFPPTVRSLPKMTRSILPHDLLPRQIDDSVVEALKEGRPLYQVDGDLLAELEPDLIITQGVCDVCAVNQGTVEQALVLLPDLVADKARVVTLSGRDFAGILDDVHRLAAMTETRDRAESLIAEAEAEWRRLSESLPTSRPRVAMLEWPDPFFYGGHWVPEMVEVAGGIDVLGRKGLDSGRCASEDILEQDPEVVISIACGYDLEANIGFARQIARRPEFRQLRAVRNRQVWAMGANSYCSRPTPRIVEGAVKLRAILEARGDGVEGIERISEL